MSGMDRADFSAARRPRRRSARVADRAGHPAAREIQAPLDHRRRALPAHRQQTAAGRQGSPGKRHCHRRDSRDARHHAREYRRTLRTPWLCAQRKCARPPPASHPDAVQSGNHQPHRDRRDPRPGVHPAPFHHQSRLRFAIRPSVGIGRKNHWSEKAERESDDPGPSHPWWGRLQPVNPSEARTLLVPTTDAANWGLT